MPELTFFNRGDWFLDVHANSFDHFDFVSNLALFGMWDIAVPLPPRLVTAQCWLKTLRLDCVGPRCPRNMVTIFADLRSADGANPRAVAEDFAAWVGTQRGGSAWDRYLAELGVAPDGGDVPETPSRVHQILMGFLQIRGEVRFQKTMWALVSVGLPDPASAVDLRLIAAFPGWWPYLDAHEIRLHYADRYSHCGICRSQARERHLQRDCLESDQRGVDDSQQDDDDERDDELYRRHHHGRGRGGGRRGRGSRSHRGRQTLERAQDTGSAA